MVDRLVRYPWAARILPGVFVALYATAACAEVLLDPTRPPDGIAGSAGDGAAYTGYAVKSQPVTRGLQMVIVSSSRRAAVIDGRTVELGGKYGEASLIEVNEDGVVLQGKQGRRVLKLYPNVKMTKAEMRTELPVAQSASAVIDTEHKAAAQEEGQ